MQYADIIIDITHEKLDKIFQYKIPAAMLETIRPGCAVMVPFGRGNRLTKGYVLGFSDTPGYDPERIKEIAELVTSENSIEERLIALAVWIRQNYGGTYIQALRTVLPVKQKVKENQERIMKLRLSPEHASLVLADYRRKRYVAKVRLLEELIAHGQVSYEQAIKDGKATYAVVKGMEKDRILSVESYQSYRNPLKLGADNPWQEDGQIALNQEQQQAVDTVMQQWLRGDYGTYLLHGITGSGKTEVYIRLIEQVISEGKQAIVLIPEIALTYQTVQRFYKHFGERVSIINSRLSKGERYDQYLRAKRGEIDVMIGPRSALFTPFSQVGLIIIDEEHESSYKSEGTPRYHAREVAIQRAEMEGASVILGSATPSVDAFYRVQCGVYRHLALNQRAKESALPLVHTVDLREELKAGNRSIISRRLHELVEQRLAAGQQVMLFINRRGYAGFLSCRSCGHVIKCPHCDVSLTSHNNGKLICHYCGYRQPKVDQCPSCSSPFISSFKAGTQQIEAMVRKEFPQANVLRMDMDTTKGKEGHHKILESFAKGEADILIGTQMIVKGHDYENVTLVGVLAADLSLHISDYRAAERTFQLLTQAAGRAGRGKLAGEVVIQTYSPEHYSIVTAAGQDYERFYQEEIGYRQMMHYPPVSNLLAVHCAGKEEEHLAMAMEYLKQYVQKVYQKPDLGIVGPADESVAKVKDLYRKVLYLKHEDYQVLVKIKDLLEKYMEVNPGYRMIGTQFDFNPMNG